MLECCVPDCTTNHPGGKELPSFKFPKTEARKKEWLNRIKKPDFTPDSKSGVCAVHFETKFVKVLDGKDGGMPTFELLDSAIPTLFPKTKRKLPSAEAKETKVVSPSSSKNPAKKSRLKGTNNGSEKLLKITSVTGATADSASKTLLINPESMLNSGKFRKIQMKTVSFADEVEVGSEIKENEVLASLGSLKVVAKRNLIRFPKWYLDDEQDTRVTLFKIESCSNPQVIVSVTIFADLKCEVYVRSRKVTEAQWTALELGESDIFDSWLKISTCLKQLDDYLAVEDAAGTSNVQNAICNLEKEILQIARHDPKMDALRFLHEQLVLLQTMKQGKVYSSRLTRLCYELYQMSQDSYEKLHDLNWLTFLSMEHVQEFEKGYGLETSKCVNRRADLKAAVKKLGVWGKYVIIQVCNMNDKRRVFASPMQNNRDSDSEDEDEDEPDKEGNDFEFTVSSIFCDYEAIAHFGQQLTTPKMLYDVCRNLILTLEIFGFTVVCVVAKSCTKMKDMFSKFCEGNSPQICCRHPSSSERPLFLVYNTPDILKSIRDDWLAKEPQQELKFPNPTNLEETMTASFGHFKKLHALQYQTASDSLVPSEKDKDDMELVYRVFNAKFLSDTELMAKNLKDLFPETVLFVKMIVKWWNIVNVKRQHSEGQDDNDQGPIKDEKDDKLQFMEFLLTWLEPWHSSKEKQGKLSSDITQALIHTCHALMEMSMYLLNECNVPYILLGKFQISSVKL